MLCEEKERTVGGAVLSLVFCYIDKFTKSKGKMQVKVCGKKLHTKIDIRNEMPDLICGRITAGEKYIMTHDTDADVLSKIADILDTKVSTLLGGTITEEADKNEVAEQLAKISEQMAIKNRRGKLIWKIIGIVLLVVVVFHILIAVLGIAAYHTRTSETETKSVTEIDDFGADIDD